MLKINTVVIKQDTFPDGTPLIKINKDVENTCPPSGYTLVSWYFDNMAELFTLKCIIDQLRKHSNKKIHLYMPYIPNARMDRVKNESDVFTLKSFCDTINAMKIDHVFVMNAHSSVSLALLNNVIDLNSDNAINMIALPKTDVIFFPDEGACKRYTEDAYKKILKDKIIAVGMKDRDWTTGKIKSLKILVDTDIKGKDVLIIDDICSYGGTFKFSAIELKKLGVSNIYLYITHCENVIDLPALKAAGITKVFTTDSIYRGKETEFISVIERRAM